MLSRLIYSLLLIAPLGAADWPELVDAVLSSSSEHSVEQIHGGASNINYKIECDSKSYFVRVAPLKQESYFADIAVEYEALSKLASLKLTPQPFYFDPIKKILVTEFVPHSQQRVDLLDRHTRRSVMEMLHRIEASGAAISRHFAPYEQTLHLARLVGKNYKKQFKNRYGAALQKIDAILAKNPKKTLCHLDLHGLNIIKSENGLLFVDWEYAMMSHPFLVIASMASIERWDDKEMKLMLEDYMGTYTEEDYRLLYLYRIAIDLFWTCWNALQSQDSPLDIPFATWERLFEEAACERLHSEYLKQILATT